MSGKFLNFNWRENIDWKFLVLISWQSFQFICMIVCIFQVKNYFFIFYFRFITLFFISIIWSLICKYNNGYFSFIFAIILQAMSTKLAYQSPISVSHHHSSSREKKQEKKDKTKKHKRKHRHKHKKDKNKDTVSHSVDIQQLRAERLKREDEEKKRAARLLSGKTNDVVQEVRLTDALDGRYNAQFHPHLARQRLCNDFKFK